MGNNNFTIDLTPNVNLTIHLACSYSEESKDQPKSKIEDLPITYSNSVDFCGWVPKYNYMIDSMPLAITGF